MTYLQRVNSKAPSTELELKALHYAVFRKNIDAANQVPTLCEVIHWIARIGGFQDHKSVERLE